MRCLLAAPVLGLVLVTGCGTRGERVDPRGLCDALLPLQDTTRVLEHPVRPVRLPAHRARGVLECRLAIPDVPQGEVSLLVDCRRPAPEPGPLREALAARVGVSHSRVRHCTEEPAAWCARQAGAGASLLLEGASIVEARSGCVIHLDISGLDARRVEALARRVLPRAREGDLRARLAGGQVD